MSESAVPWPRSRRDDRESSVVRTIGRARGYLARHRPLVGLLCDALAEAGFPVPGLAPAPLRSIDRGRLAVPRLASLFAADPAAAASARSALDLYVAAQAAVCDAEAALAAGGESPAPEDLLDRVLPLERFNDVFAAHAGLSELLPTTRLAPAPTRPLAEPGAGGRAPTREIDKLLRVEEGLERMRAALDKLWGQAKVLQAGLDLLANPALDDLSGGGRTMALARPLASVLASGTEEATAVRAFLDEFYGFQAALQNERARLERLGRESRPQAPDIRELRAWFHRLGSAFHSLNSRPRIREVLGGIHPATAPITQPWQDTRQNLAPVADYVGRARAALAQIKPRRDLLALAYQQLVGGSATAGPDEPGPEHLRSAQALLGCLAASPDEARAVAAALESHERARAALEDVERRLRAAETASPDQRMAILEALDLDALREAIDPLAHFGREFRGHPVLGRLFRSPSELLRQTVPAAPPVPGDKPGGLLEGLFRRIRPKR